MKQKLQEREFNCQEESSSNQEGGTNPEETGQDPCVCPAHYKENRDVYCLKKTAGHVKRLRKCICVAKCALCTNHALQLHFSAL